LRWSTRSGSRARKRLRLSERKGTVRSRSIEHN